MAYVLAPLQVDYDPRGAAEARRAFGESSCALRPLRTLRERFRFYAPDAENAELRLRGFAASREILSVGGQLEEEGGFTRRRGGAEDEKGRGRRPAKEGRASLGGRSALSPLGVRRVALSQGERVS